MLDPPIYAQILRIHRGRPLEEQDFFELRQEVDVAQEIVVRSTS